jgi:dTDP-4-dehydrorhamnose reductase
MKELLLTGSSSFTGTKFVDLYGDKYDITAISRSGLARPVDLNDLGAVTELFNEVKPGAVVHLAATIGRDAGNADVLEVDVKTTKHLIDLAKATGIPFVYTSSEIIYNGRPEGMYREDDDYNPRSDYGKSKMISEQYLKAAGIPYLITRGHRYIGYPSARFDRPKQFPDAIRDLMEGKSVHAESHKQTTFLFIDDLCRVIDQYLQTDADQQIVLNVALKEVATYEQLLKDIAAAAGLDTGLVLADGEEPGWLDNNTLSTDKLRQLGYPQTSYEDVVKSIAADIKANLLI